MDEPAVIHAAARLMTIPEWRLREDLADVLETLDDEANVPDDLTAAGAAAWKLLGRRLGVLRATIRAASQEAEIVVDAWRRHIRERRPSLAEWHRDRDQLADAALDASAARGDGGAGLAARVAVNVQPDPLDDQMFGARPAHADIPIVAFFTEGGRASQTARAVVQGDARSVYTAARDFTRITGRRLASRPDEAGGPGLHLVARPARAAHTTHTA